MQSRIPGPTTRATPAISSVSKSLATMNRQGQSVSCMNKHNTLPSKSSSHKDLSDNITQLPAMNGNVQLNSTRHQYSSSNTSQQRNLPPNRKQTSETSSKQTARQFSPSSSPSINDLEKVSTPGNEKSSFNANKSVEEHKYHSKTSRQSTEDRAEVFVNNKGLDGSVDVGNPELCGTEPDSGEFPHTSPRIPRKGIGQYLNKTQNVPKFASKIPDRGQKEEKSDTSGINSRGKVASAKASRLSGLNHTRSRALNDVQKGVATLPPRGKCKSRLSISNDNLLQLSRCGSATDTEKPKHGSSQRQWKSDVSWKSYSFSNLHLDDSEDLCELSLSSMISPKRTATGGVKMSFNSNVIKLPSPTQNSHPNTATVAPFMYKGETKRESMNAELKEPTAHPNIGECNWKHKKSLEDIVVDVFLPRVKRITSAIQMM